MAETFKDAMVAHILASKGLIKSEINNQNNSFKYELNAKNFYTDTNPNGICSKLDLDAILINGENIKGIHSMIDLMSNGEKISFNASPYTNSKGETFQYLRIQGDKGIEQIKVPYFIGLEKLLRGYVKGTFSFIVTFDELYSELQDKN